MTSKVTSCLLPHPLAGAARPQLASKLRQEASQRRSLARWRYYSPARAAPPAQLREESGVSLRPAEQPCQRLRRSQGKKTWIGPAENRLHGGDARRDHGRTRRQGLRHHVGATLHLRGDRQKPRARDQRARFPPGQLAQPAVARIRALLEERVALHLVA